MIIMFVLVIGFEKELVGTTIVYAIVNAILGIIICNFLRVQGVQFGKLENQELVKKYYSTKTKDKKPRSMTYFWIKHIIQDIFIKGLGVIIFTVGTVFIVIVGSNDYNLILLAVTNLIMFICFGILALNSAYEYFNNSFVPYMNEKLKESLDNDKIQ